MAAKKEEKTDETDNTVPGYSGSPHEGKGTVDVPAATPTEVTVGESLATAKPKEKKEK